VAITDPATGRRYDVLDIHHHIGSTSVMQAGPRRAGDAATEAAERMGFMDRFGIDRACVMPAARSEPRADGRTVNDVAAAYRDAQPHRFPFAFALADVWAGSAGLDELSRALTELSLDGVAWHHRLQGALLDHPAMDGALALCAAHGVPAILHVFPEDALAPPWRLARLAERFSDVTFVVLDALGHAIHHGEILDLAARLPNTVFDTATMAISNEIFERWTGRLGDERLVLGTDLYINPRTYNFPAPLFEILHSSIPEASKARILAGNADRLLSGQARAHEHDDRRAVARARKMPD
jgi:uncharacterized protein